MPPLFDQYKSMDRGATKRLSAGGGKETIRLTLLQAASQPKSKVVTMLLIRDLLLFKVAQARDKKNTDLLNRILASLPSRIAVVNNLRDKQMELNNTIIELPDDLNEFSLRAFIANSSSVFQRQIPDTFRRLLVEILRPDFYGRTYLVDNYTADFLCNNKLISEGDVRNARIVPVGVSKPPNALEMKMFIGQALDWMKFNETTFEATRPFFKIANQITLDADRYNHQTGLGLGDDKTWLNHIYHCQKLIDEACAVNQSWSNVKNNVANKGAYKSLSHKLQSVRPNLGVFRQANWLVYFSLQQLFANKGGTFCGNIYYHWSRTREDQEDPRLDYNLPCSLPGGWETFRHIYVLYRYSSPTSYDLTRKSFKHMYVFELFWVQNPETRLPQDVIQPDLSIYSLVDDSRDHNPQCQASWWVQITLNYTFSFRNIQIYLPPPDITLIPTQPNYEVEVFDSKPEYPRIKWPSPF